MSEYTRNHINNLKEEVRIFENVGLKWLAQRSKKELEVLTSKIEKKLIN